MLRIENVTDDKLEFAGEIFHRIFSWVPEFNPFAMQKDMDPKELKMFYEKARVENHIVYDDDKVIGLEGIYIIPGNEESGFLGYFGVVPEERRNHYGARILELHEDELRKRGYKFSRLWTDTLNNEKTRKFYESQGYIGELYNCPDDPAFKPGSQTIYSKALGDFPLEPWNNRNIGVPFYGLIIKDRSILESFADYDESVTDRDHS